MNSKQMTALAKDIEKIILAYDKLELDTGVIIKVLKHNTVLKDDLIKHIEGLKKVITPEMENELGEDYPYEEHGYNNALQDILDYLKGEL